jgi:GT2 family glycosyltransferase
MKASPVSVVILSRNRLEALRTVLDQIWRCDYPADSLEIIVVDNGSSDGTRSFLEATPEVRAVLRGDNAGISGWNDGFRKGTGEWILALDDDCYLEPAGLSRAVQAAVAGKADLVSFLVRDPRRPVFVFNRHYNTGLLSFWGCAVLFHHRVLSALGGFDPEIFVWGHEPEFMMRFFDAGFRHLYLPIVTAFHMNAPAYSEFRLLTNHRHLGYIAGARFPGSRGVRALAALMVPCADGLGRQPFSPRNWKLAAAAMAGYADGRLRHHRPVCARVADIYLKHFIEFSLRLRIRPTLRVTGTDRRRYFPYLLETASLQLVGGSGI